MERYRHKVIATHLEELVEQLIDDVNDGIDESEYNQRFDRILEAVSHRLFTYVQGIAKGCSREQCEDLYQEAVLKLWKELPNCKARPVGGWILRVVRNRIMDELRREGPKMAVTKSLEDMHQPKSSYSSDDLEQAAILQEALAALRPEYRPIAMLTIAGATEAEISKKVKLSISTVKYYRREIRTVLRAFLNLREA